MKNMKVKLKLLISFIAIAIITLVVGIVCVNGLLTLTSNENTLYNLMVNNTYAIGLSANIQEQRVLFRDVIMNMDDKAELDSTMAQWDKVSKEYSDMMSYLEAHILTGQGRDYITKTSGAYTEYSLIRNELAGAVAANNAAQAELLLAKAVPSIDTMITALEGMNEYATTVCGATNNSDQKTAYTMIAIVAALAVLAMASAIILGLYVAGLISKPLVPLNAFMNRAGSTGDITLSQEDIDCISKFSLRKDELGQVIFSTATFVKRMHDISDVIERISNGDLTAELALLSDTDTMGHSLQKMLKNLNSMFGEINSSSRQVSTGSKQIADGAQSLAQGSTEQASTVEQLSASISEIAEQTKRNADIAKEAAALSNTIRSNAEKGSVQMDQMMSSVREINEASNQISKVIKVIDDIAFQTNILALNAAVEAARAGQHGKGFAVVAEEVRNLAAKSAEAAKDTGGLIENSIEKANLGLNIATETATSLKDIVEGINHNAEIMAQIAQASDEQSGAINQINTGIDQVAQVVQQNSATAEESAAASQQMTGQADMLEQLISQFTLKETGYIPPQALLSESAKKKPAGTEKPASVLNGSHSRVYGKY